MTKAKQAEMPTENQQERWFGQRIVWGKNQIKIEYPKKESKPK